MKSLRRSYYDFFSKFYDRFVSLHSRVPQGEMKRSLAELTPIEYGDRILDICCGTGSLLLALRERCGPAGFAVGLDFSRGMLNVSRGKAAVYSNTCFVQADVAFLPFASRSFDTVTCTHAFYELKGTAQDRALGEVIRVLKPGKAFLMVEHQIPENPFARTLYYLRLGVRKAVSILRHEKATLEMYFRTVDDISFPTGKTKILLCRK